MAVIHSHGSLPEGIKTNPGERICEAMYQSTTWKKDNCCQHESIGTRWDKMGQIQPEIAEESKTLKWL